MKRFLLENLKDYQKYLKQDLPILDQNGDEQTTNRICSILKQNIPVITGLSLNKIQKFTYISGENLGNAIKVNNTLRKLHLHQARLQTQGANRVIEGIKLNKLIQDYDFGQLTNTSLKYLVKYLSGEHNVRNLSFSEDISEIWTDQIRMMFLNVLRDNPYNKQLLSVDIYSERIEENQNFIAEISILCQNNRTAEITKKNNEYKSKELNTSHSEYYDGDNHVKNAFSFSVKSYMSNVIETLLDEGLYYLDKERANIIRDEKIFDINKEFVNKQILDDIFKADGSLLVLAKYMINKLNKINN
ncbi:hypothetical protein IMG5_128340 [Ichthyophthirius multifiliis]|uniref:Uncharacterized protein n=1 Tax=Ichthyophthirius multifiliis TaxID=5932 RepID=G0QW09_ICHMU|nr:hypothetical protein IMG5_128340 [Ichthyophthirius multifiliis]EGR30602.1 hypothetical protein IMG5_128340 [Ichthyophthirius multifiliis]|eukprot:XP_004032189.1 hypothetical protein IMG5_128340 [Ichthyophthirius multifiliis]